MWNCAGLLNLSEEDSVFLWDGKDMLGGQRISGTSANWSGGGVARRRNMSGTHPSLIQEEAGAYISGTSGKARDFPYSIFDNRLNL